MAPWPSTWKWHLEHPWGKAMDQLQDFVLHGTIPGPKTWDFMRYDMISILRGRERAKQQAIPRKVGSGSNVLNRDGLWTWFVCSPCSIQQTQNMPVRRVRRLPWARASDLRCSPCSRDGLKKQASCEELFVHFNMEGQKMNVNQGLMHKKLVILLTIIMITIIMVIVINNNSLW